jgi:ELWxxDGT repeat protein
MTSGRPLNLRAKALPWALFLALLRAVAAPAQVASLAADLNPDLASSGAAFSSLTPLGGRLLFQGFPVSAGQEIWSTDGTAAGTRLLAASCPGGCSSMSVMPPQDDASLVYWIAEPVPGSAQLWRSDGTPRGTFPVGPEGQALIAPGAAVGGDRVVFGALTPDLGFEPWVSDGTPEGTTVLLDLFPGPGSSLRGAVRGLGPIALFFAGDEQHSNHIWRTDGTPEGTAPIADLGALASPYWFEAQAGGKAFISLSGPSGSELWTSDGTAAGTRRVRAFSEFGSVFYFGSSVSLGDEIVFVFYNQEQGEELWVSDGTPAGTHPITDTETRYPFGPGTPQVAVTSLFGRYLYPPAAPAAWRPAWPCAASDRKTNTQA